MVSGAVSGPRLRQKQARARGDAGEQQNEQNAAEAHGLHSTKPGCRQRDVGSGPRGLEPGFGERRIGRLVLGAQRLQQAEERPAVLAVPPQILPVDGLGLLRRVRPRAGWRRARDAAGSGTRTARCRPGCRRAAPRDRDARSPDRSCRAPPRSRRPAPRPRAPAPRRWCWARTSPASSIRRRAASSASRARPRRRRAARVATNARPRE